MLNNFFKKIENKRNSTKYFWKLIIFLKDFLWKIKFYSTNIFLHILSLILNCKDFKKIIKINYDIIIKNKKYIVFEGDQKYFFHNFKPIYNKLENKENIYFIKPFRSKINYSEYLIYKNIKPKKIISSSYAFYIKWTIYINSWIPTYYPNPLNNPFIKNKIQIYHGIGSYTFDTNNLTSLNNKKELQKFNVHFAVNLQHFLSLKRIGKDIKIYEVGYPRMDKFYNNLFKKEDISKEFNIKKDWPIIVYSPHHLKNSSFKDSIKIINILLGMKLNLILKIHEAVYVYKEYINIIDTLKKIKADNFFFASKTESTPYYFIADLVITDVCSTSSFESCLADKPTIIIENKDWLKENNKVGYLEKIAVKANYSLNSLSDLQKLISYVLANKNEKSIKRKELLKESYYNLGKSTEIAVKIITELLNN